VDDALLLERMWSSMRAIFRLFARGAPESKFVELDGVDALVVPATPHRSVLNSVLYRDAERLGDALDELARTYERAGVRAWTVWVHPDDEDARRLLERAGHVLDATPTGMGLELKGFAPSAPEAANWTRAGDLAALLHVNDLAYGWGDTRPWTRALGDLPSEELSVYTASVDGKPASGLMVHQDEGDADVWLVATLDAARGRGLAPALLGRALVDARERGCTTSTLQATKLGEPVYAQLGYRTLGRLEMWERRGTA
jgi:ribosomal protein S18 acetylase RimI-like enzyme